MEQSTNGSCHPPVRFGMQTFGLWSTSFKSDHHHSNNSGDHQGHKPNGNIVVESLRGHRPFLELDSIADAQSLGLQPDAQPQHDGHQCCGDQQGANRELPDVLMPNGYSWPAWRPWRSGPIAERYACEEECKNCGCHQNMLHRDFLLPVM